MRAFYLLETNAASDTYSGRSEAQRTAVEEALSRGDQVAISVLSHAEILDGFAKNPLSTRLHAAYLKLLNEIMILPWTENAAHSYAALRLHLHRKQKVIDSVDLLIASQAHAVGATLISRDNAFRYVADVMNVVNWATDLPVRG